MALDVICGVVESRRREIPDVDMVASSDEDTGDAAAKDTAADNCDGTVGSGFNTHIGDIGRRSMRGGRWQCRCLLVYKMYVDMTWTAEKGVHLFRKIPPRPKLYSLLYMSFL